MGQKKLPNSILALILVEAGKPPLGQLEMTDVAVDLPTRIMDRTVEQILNPGQRLAANPARVHKLNIASVSGKTTRRAIMPLLRNENISGVFPCNGK